MPIISVIVPVYNVEPYLRCCLDSVVKQTLQDFEIICVNDASQDACAAILAEYAQKDARIKILAHEHNQGLSAARNTGMAAASGEYIYFLDSDDWVDCEYLEEMLRAAYSSKAEVIMNTNIMREYDDGRSEWYWQQIGRDTTGFISSIDNLDNISHTAWSYIYKKSFLDKVKVKFTERLCYEDVYFNYTTLVCLDKIYLINKPAYHYRIRKNSIMADIKKWIDMILWV